MESGLVAAIGRTPLVRLTRIERDVTGLELYGKLEASNPGGSVKDRAARHMILEGIRSGALAPGKRLLDATSGNTGIAYAMLGAARGFPVTLCLPASASPEPLPQKPRAALPSPSQGPPDTGPGAKVRIPLNH